MLLSMTGFGSSSDHDGQYTATIELKSVNNRYLKVSTKLPDYLSVLEPDFERTIRETVARGTLNVSVRFAPIGQASRYRLATSVLKDYWVELSQLSRECSLPPETFAQGLLSLPGVVSDELSTKVDAAAQWPFLQRILKTAVERLDAFRKQEGEAMRQDLALNCRHISERLAEVQDRAPKVVSEFRDKILNRVTELLRESGATVTASDIVREVSIFSDRCDINEEIARLRCHLEQFARFMDDAVSQGRKLDFLCQEMFREINTIGSKANDVEIAHLVVEMKTSLERVREVLQNVE